MISLVNHTTGDSAGLFCGNRSLSADNHSRMSADCRLYDDWPWFDGNIELKELFKNVALGLVLVAACLLTIIGNVLVLHAVRTERKLQTVRQSLKTNASFYTRILKDEFLNVVYQDKNIIGICIVLID